MAIFYITEIWFSYSKITPKIDYHIIMFYITTLSLNQRLELGAKSNSIEHTNKETNSLQALCLGTLVLSFFVYWPEAKKRSICLSHSKDEY